MITANVARLTNSDPGNFASILFIGIRGPEQTFY